jgi:stage V sporulation protein B
MGLGSVALPRFVPRSWHPLRVYAGLELSIGVIGLILLVALPIAGVGRRGRSDLTTRQHLAFLAPLLGGQLALNLLFQCDLTLLGRFAADAAAAKGLAVTEADSLAGAYRNAQLFCFLPYQFLLSVTFVLFPVLATAKRDGDHAAVARYTKTGVRLAILIAGGMVSVTASLPHSLLSLVFGQDSAALGSDAMAVLAVGLGSFAVFGILVTVLTSLGREKLSAALTVVALATVVTLCFVLVRGQSFGAHMLLRSAYATSAGLGLATIMAAIAVKKVAGAVVAPLSLVRTGVAVSCCIAIGRAIGALGRVETLLAAAGLGVVYLLLLVISRELGRKDLELIRRVMRRSQ